MQTRTNKRQRILAARARSLPNPMMPELQIQDRSGDRQVCRQADDKNRGVRLDASPHQSSHCVGKAALAALAAPSFVRHIRTVKAVSVSVAISILLLVFARSFAQPWHYPFLGLQPSLRSIHHQLRGTGSHLLEVFQVYPPVLITSPTQLLELTDGSTNVTVSVIDSEEPACQQILVDHTFASSYGAPFVGAYNPPGCSFNRVTWNLTVVSAGRQFDRSGFIFLGNTEVFRTSTAEPTTDGIRWTYLKDMTTFLPMFKDEQKIIFDLGNVVNKKYTAAFHIVLTASYFTTGNAAPTADLIVPVSTQKAYQNLPSLFELPKDTAIQSLVLPRNVKRAVFTVAATGQYEEEFWWSNALQSDIDIFPRYGSLYGYSPFREIRLLIDGRLAGVVWPFPIIFAGGVVPSLWRPIVGIDAFDLREDEIDITPWLPLLCDGNAHTFAIRVSGLYSSITQDVEFSDTVGSFWLVSGKIFIWLDEEGHVTTGSKLDNGTSTAKLRATSSVLKGADGNNKTLLYQVTAHRIVSLESTINLSTGPEIATWYQNLTFSNAGNFTDDADIEINDQHTFGYDISSSGYARHFSYPLYAHSEYKALKDNVSIVADVSHGKDIKTFGHSVFPSGLESFLACEAVHNRCGQFDGAWLSTTQTGTATYLANETASESFSFGETEQDMAFKGIHRTASNTLQDSPIVDASEMLFHRCVQAINGTVVKDIESLLETPIGHLYGATHQVDAQTYISSKVQRPKVGWKSWGWI